LHEIVTGNVQQGDVPIQQNTCIVHQHVQFLDSGSDLFVGGLDASIVCHIHHKRLNREAVVLRLLGCLIDPGSVFTRKDDMGNRICPIVS